MKKYIVIFLCLLFLFGCSHKKMQTNENVIGQIIFDDEVITFYEEETIFNDGMITSSYLYYKSDRINLKQDGTLTSKDGSLKLYVDFYDVEVVTNENGELILPTNQLLFDEHYINVYVLDASEKHYVKNRESNDYTVLTYISSATGSSSVSSQSIDMNFDLLKVEVESWEKLDDYTVYANYKDFEFFLEIQKNKREIDGFVEMWQFYKVELDNGCWVVSIGDFDREYYLLNEKQTIDFKNLIGY